MGRGCLRIGGSGLLRGNGRNGKVQLSMSFMLVLCLFTPDRTGCQLLHFMSDYVSLRWLAGTWSSTTRQEHDRNNTGTR